MKESTLKKLENIKLIIEISVLVSALVVTIIQALIMNRQSEIMVEQTKIAKSQGNPHFELTSYIKKSYENKQITNIGLCIIKDGGFASNVKIDQFSIISTKIKSFESKEDLVKFGVFNYYTHLYRDPTELNKWYFTSDDNWKTINSYNQLLSGKNYKGQPVEPLTVKTYLKISYTNQYAEEINEFFIVDDFNMSKITNEQGVNAYAIYEKVAIGDMYYSLLNALTKWISDNCV